jgi:hypothetical protein
MSREVRAHFFRPAVILINPVTSSFSGENVIGTIPHDKDIMTGIYQIFIDGDCGKGCIEQKNFHKH